MISTKSKAASPDSNASSSFDVFSRPLATAMRTVASPMASSRDIQGVSGVAAVVSQALKSGFSPVMRKAAERRAASMTPPGASENGGRAGGKPQRVVEGRLGKRCAVDAHQAQQAAEFAHREHGVHVGRGLGRQLGRDRRVGHQARVTRASPPGRADHRGKLRHVALVLLRHAGA